MFKYSHIHIAVLSIRSGRYIGRILLQDRRDKHNQRNIEREPSRAPIPVNAEDLVQVGREGGGDETMQNIVSNYPFLTM